MKHIIKGSEPAELLEWKAGDRMFQRGNPRWGKIPSEIKDLIRERLRAEQGGLCCYCERMMQPNDYHNEHIKPQGLSIYSKFQADYDNLLCSCQFELEEGEPRHCGNSKGSWYDEALFISPLDPDCEGRFSYTLDGYIKPADINDAAAVETIHRLQLDIPKLRALRSAVISTFDELNQEELGVYLESYLKDKSENGGYYNEFNTTIRFLFA